MTRMMDLRGSKNAITSIGDFVMNMMMPTWCFQRGMHLHLWNYWRKKVCENTEEKCAAGYVSSCCPGQYAGQFVNFKSIVITGFPEL